jgi:hypothetical protein
MNPFDTQVDPAETREEIPRDQWSVFLDRFSLQHENWLVDVFSKTSDQELVRLAHELPLQSIAASLKAGDDDTMSIVLANTKTEMLSHNQPRVRRMFLLENPQGAHTGLVLEGSDGTETILRFRATGLPETIDGVMDGNE